jgi:hypothetical protein
MKTSLKVRGALWVTLVLTVLCWGLFFYGRSLWVPVYYRLVGRRTVQEAVAFFAPIVEPRMMSAFQAANLAYPPKELALLAFKEERVLELWARDQGHWVYVHTYPVKGASGILGPKLREGDRQVPEGIYTLEGLNPNSSFHLSMKVNYPNSTDQSWAKADGRTRLGGDIFIHGSSGSVGCLAMGDDAIEELFVLVDRVGKENVTVIISPRDLRRVPPPDLRQPKWVPELYADLHVRLKEFRAN